MAAGSNRELGHAEHFVGLEWRVDFRRPKSTVVSLQEKQTMSSSLLTVGKHGFGTQQRWDAPRHAWDWQMENVDQGFAAESAPNARAMAGLALGWWVGDSGEVFLFLFLESLASSNSIVSNRRWMAICHLNLVYDFH